jgi:hypothetical protein
VDVIDTANGTCLGRLLASHATLALAVSPDGKRLAALGPARRGAGLGGPVNVSGEKGPKQVQAEGWREVRAWDLADGSQAGSAHLRPVHSRSLQWIGPRQLLVGGASEADLDARWGMFHWAVPERATALPNPPDGRVWFTLPGQGGGEKGPPPGRLVAVAAPARKAGDLTFGPKVPVKVEVDCGSEARNAEATAALTKVLKDMGQTVGDGGWALRMTAREQDTRREMKVGLARKETVKVPSFSGSVKLLAPDGAEVWSSGTSANFPGQSSRYYKKKEDVIVGPQAEWVEHYDFGGRDPREAMADEVWGHLLSRSRFYGLGVVNVGGRRVTLPLEQAVGLP